MLKSHQFLYDAANFPCHSGKTQVIRVSVVHRALVTAKFSHNFSAVDHVHIFVAVFNRTFIGVPYDVESAARVGIYRRARS